MNAITIQNLSKRFGDTEVLTSINLEFEAGQIYGIVGRNGSGKSVLLKCIAGLVLPTSGEIRVLGKRIGKDVDFAPRTGIAIEQPGLLLRKSAYENMKTLAALTKRPSSEEIDRLIQMVGLNSSEKKPVGKYSMGMKQRLSIAMALMDNPDILLLDEPMSNLDNAGAAQMRALYQELAQRGKTILIATHVQEDVTELCNHICCIEDGRANIKGTDSGIEKP